MFNPGDIVIVDNVCSAKVVRTLDSGRIVLEVDNGAEQTTFTHDEWFGIMLAHTRPAIQRFGVDPQFHSVVLADEAAVDATLKNI